MLDGRGEDHLRSSLRYSYNAGSAGLVDGQGMGLPDKFDDSVPSTRGLYSSPSPLCLLEIRMKNTWAT